MKKLFFALALVLSSLASAESIKVFETRYHSGTDYYPEIQVNKSLGRAWVNVVEVTSFGDSTNYSDNRVKVEGLSYNAADKTIVLERDGQSIVCGELYNRRFVLDGGNSVRLAERCSFTKSIVKVSVDNGFEIKYKKMLEVYLNVE